MGGKKIYRLWRMLEDRRVKLNPQQKHQIRVLWSNGKGASKSSLARLFNVSRQTIRRVVDPVYAAIHRRENNIRNQLRWNTNEAARKRKNELCRLRIAEKRAAHRELEKIRHTKKATHIEVAERKTQCKTV